MFIFLVHYVIVSYELWCALYCFIRQQDSVIGQWTSGSSRHPSLLSRACFRFWYVQNFTMIKDIIIKVFCLKPKQRWNFNLISLQMIFIIQFLELDKRSQHWHFYFRHYIVHIGVMIRRWNDIQSVSIVAKCTHKASIYNLSVTQN